jgi:diguanylate cyclase (GGDEF)-like protein
VQAISDGLTGIHNHRHFQETLKSSVSRAGRYGETFCLLMMDLDHFKAVNDTVGHQQGDEVLRSVAGALRGCSRDSDYLARYGGEEFVMLLPQTSLNEARNMAERICTQVRRIDAGAPDLKVSMSIGVASYPDSAADSDGVLHAADAALLRAKARGRNRVCLYTEEQLAHTTLDGRLVDLGRRFARQIGLSEEETGGLITALAVCEITGALREEVRAVLGRAEDVTEAAAAPAVDVRSSAYNALLYGSEHWDGTGYPNGLRGERIPRVARAFAVCREYGEVGHEAENGSRLAKLRAKAARELDPRMVQRFANLMREAKPAAPGQPTGAPSRST